jgi:hypothetical protein
MLRFFLTPKHISPFYERTGLNITSKSLPKGKDTKAITVVPYLFKLATRCYIWHNHEICGSVEDKIDINYWANGRGFGPGNLDFFGPQIALA